MLLVGTVLWKGSRVLRPNAGRSGGGDRRRAVFTVRGVGGSNTAVLSHTFAQDVPVSGVSSVISPPTEGISPLPGFNANSSSCSCN